MRNTLRFICLVQLFMGSIVAVGSEPLEKEVLNPFVNSRAAALATDLAIETWYSRKLRALANEPLTQKEREAKRRQINNAWDSLRQMPLYIAAGAGAIDAAINKRNDQKYGGSERVVGSVDLLAEMVYRRQKQKVLSRNNRLSRFILGALELIASRWRHCLIERSDSDLRLATIVQRIAQLAHFWFLHNDKPLTPSGQWRHLRRMSKIGKFSLLLKCINLWLTTIKEPLEPEQRVRRIIRPRNQGLSLLGTIVKSRLLVQFDRATVRTEQEMAVDERRTKKERYIQVIKAMPLDFARIKHSRGEVIESLSNEERQIQAARDLVPVMDFLSKVDNELTAKILSYL